MPAPETHDHPHRDHLDLAARRRELGIPIDALAERSGVSSATVKRVLRGDTRVSFENVARVAAALGMGVHLRPVAEADALRRRQAREKAERIVRQVQGNAALEAQQVSQSERRAMVKRTTDDLLRSPRRLWAA